MNWLRGTKGMLLLAAVAMLGTTCTLLLDHSAIQCTSAADCDKIDKHRPICQNGLCVASGFQPAGCFLPIPPMKGPTNQDDFLNACSVNAMPPNPGGDPNGCGMFTMQVDDGGMLKTPITPTPNPPVLPPTPASLCSELVPSGKQILFVTGSSNFAPLLQEMSEAIVKHLGIIPVFRTTSSCLGVKALNLNNPTFDTDKYIKDPIGPTDPYPSWAQIFLGDGSLPTNCRLGSKTLIDIGESEIAQETCGPPVSPPDSLLESVGPILPILFVVPTVSTQRVISVGAARQIFGTGGNLPPWTTPSYLYIRGQATATLRLVGKEIGLLPTQFWGTDQGSALNMANNLGIINNQDSANSALGIIGSDFYDQPVNRQKLKALGFQATNQDCAYLPDSSLTTRDKVNVRDGHYPLWGRIHFFYPISNGAPVSMFAAQFVTLFAGPMFDVDVLTALINAGFVPPCAMKVTRDSELGDFTYDDPPPASCGCFFDAQVNTTPARPECQPCGDGMPPCPDDRMVCNYGYCEQNPA